MELLEFDILQSGVVILLLLSAGELLGRLCRGTVPGILLAGVLFVAGCWSGLLPADLQQLAGLAQLTPVAILMTIASMGASMSLRQFAANWRVAAVAAMTYIGQVLAVFLVIGGLFGVNMAVGGLPGGMAAALIVQERARTLGYDQVIVLSVLVLTTQALIGCPVAAAGIRREAKRLRTLPGDAQAATAEQSRPRRWKDVQYGALLRLYIAAWAASRLEMLTGVSRYVLALLIGLALASVGFLAKDEMARTKSDGFLFYLLMSSVIAGFGSAKPEMFGQMLPILVLTLAASTAGAILASTLTGRLLGISVPMSMALGMNVMVGFPMNMLISQEIIEGLTEDAAERQRLMNEIAAKMVLGGMVTTTFLATLAAGLLAPLMH